MFSIKKEISYANSYDIRLAKTIEAREKDWRNGAIVYQVLVDRFAPSKNLEAKKGLYAPPKILRAWSEIPKRGKYSDKEQLWTHEIDFWGGDLDSLSNNLNYIHDLGVDLLYLNPINHGHTNHKYDSLDYHKVSPELGTRSDVIKLTQKVHDKNIKIVLDGAFNHMGRNSKTFQDAIASSNSKYRNWFYFGDEYPGGYRTWTNAQNLPEINWENKKVRRHIYGDNNSVVQSYLRDGIDGWRLDVAFDIGFNYLEELTKAAHERKPGSLVVGEISNYPKEWFLSLDGIINLTAREIIWKMILGEINPHTVVHMLERMIDEAGIDNMLKSWLVLDNHDTPRLINMLPKIWQQKMAQVIQFTLPGSPNLYYGVELGMTGGEDPEMRAPMRWDWVTDDNQTLKWTKRLIAIRKQHRALKLGNFRLLTSHKLVAYERYTDRVEDTIIVVANPHQKEITETMMVANSKLMNFGTLIDLLGNYTKTIHITASLVRLTLPTGGVVILKPDVTAQKGYTSYKRVQ